MARRTWVWIGIVTVVVIAAVIVAVVVFLHAPKVSEETATQRFTEVSSVLSDAVSADSATPGEAADAGAADAGGADLATPEGRASIAAAVTRLRSQNTEEADPNTAGNTVDAVTVRPGDVELSGNADGTTSATTTLTITRHLAEDDIEWTEQVTCELVLENSSGSITELLLRGDDTDATDDSRSHDDR